MFINECDQYLTMKKGIATVISAIILVLIVIAMVAIVWNFMLGYFLPPISKTFEIPENGAYCIEDAGEIILKVYLTNTGYQSILRPDDFMIKEIDMNLIDPVDLENFRIGGGNTSVVLSYNCNTAASQACDDNGVPGEYKGMYHLVRLGTQSKVEEIPIYCAS